MTSRPGIRTVVALCVTLVFWASAFAAIKVGMGPHGYGPGELALLRFATASAVLGIYAAIKRMPLPRREDLPLLAAVGICGITVYHVCLNFGERTVAAGAASLIIAASPIFTAVLAAIFLKERLRTIGWFGIAVSFAGVAMISFGGSSGVHFNADATLVAVAALASAVFVVASKSMMTRYGPLELTTYVIWAGTIPMLYWAPGLISAVPHAGAASTLAGLYLGVFPAAIAYLTWSYALSRMSASAISSTLYLSPVLATVIAFVWLGEIPTALTLVGGAVAIAGVVILGTRGRPTKGPADR